MQTKQEEIISFIKFLEEKHIHLMDIRGGKDRFVCGVDFPSDFNEVITLIEEWNKNK